MSNESDIIRQLEMDTQEEELALDSAPDSAPDSTPVSPQVSTPDSAPVSPQVSAPDSAPDSTPVSPQVSPQVSTPDSTPVDKFELYRLLQKRINPRPDDGSNPVVVELDELIKHSLSGWEISELSVHKDFSDANRSGNNLTFRIKGCFAYGPDFTEPYEISHDSYRTTVFNSDSANEKMGTQIKNKLNGYKKPGEMKTGEKLNLHRGNNPIDDKKLKVTIRNIFKLDKKVKSTTELGSSNYILFLLINDDLGNQTPPKEKKPTDQFIICVRGDESIREPDNSIFDKAGHSFLSYIQPKKGGVKKIKSHKKGVSSKKHKNKKNEKTSTKMSVD
jgi:hypothetical protein